MAKVVGIDLGTTNSVVACVIGGETKVIPTSEGGNLCPSVVAFTKQGERLVGQLARRQAILNSDRTVSSVKREMGTKWRKNIDGKDYSPEQISAFVLMKLKQDAEAYLGEKVTKAVITTPAYFNDSQRQATKQAGEIAGLEVLRIINEPTAASLAYGLDKKKEETILVWDLGGGTFDVSVLEIGDGVFEVKATNGNTHLGGDDYDQRVMDWICEEFKKQQGIDLKKDKQATQRVKEAAEKAKIELSQVVTTNINLPFISQDADKNPVHLDLTLTRAKFEDITSDLTEKCIGPFNQVISDSNLKKEDIDEVILVGGATRMPVIQELVRSLTGKEPNKGVNPDEVVALGAAIQAGVLAGEVKDIVLVDVTPLSLGIETLGGISTKLITRNTTIPTKKSEVFTTAQDFQDSVEIHILQGEREMASDNKSLGKFHLTGIPPAQRGIPQIEVTFDIDANGILNVTAKDKATGKQQAITITGASTLTKEEAERAVKDAEKWAQSDKKKREKVEAKNNADALIYQTEKLLKDIGDKISPSDKQNIESAISNLKSAVEKEDADDIKRKMDDLRSSTSKASEILYQQASQQKDVPSEEYPPTSSSGAENTQTPEGEVIDGEYRPAN